MADGEYCYHHPRPALTADIIVVTRESKPRVLLILRKHPPFAGVWALPGGFVDQNEPLEAAARRELREETGLEVGELAQLQTYGDPGRDPRGWTVSVVFVAIVDPTATYPRAGEDAAQAAWYPIDRLPPLAFDHQRIVDFARQWLTSHFGEW